MGEPDEVRFQGEVQMDEDMELLDVMNRLNECLDEHGEQHGITEATVIGVKPKD